MKNENLHRWFKGSKVVGENGQPLVVYHATTHKFFEFTRDRGNVENHFGIGYYFTDSKLDAETNYLSEGADITKRIETLAERISNNEEIDYEKAKKKAAKLLKGKHEIVLPFYLRMVNPINVTKDKDGTRFDALETEDEETGEYVENEESLPFKLFEAIKEVSYDFYGNSINPYDIFGGIGERISDWDYAAAYDVDKAFREVTSERIEDFVNEDGDIANNEFIRRVYEEMGFDGIIMDASLEFGHKRKMGRPMQMDEGTRHYIVFQSNQAKLANGKNTTFDIANPDIRYGRGGVFEQWEYSIGGL